LKIYKITFISTLILALTTTSFAQINDPYIPQGVPESITFPWITMGMICVITIGYAYAKIQDSYPILQIFKAINQKQALFENRLTSPKPIIQLTELEGQIPRYIPEKPQTMKLDKVSWITKQNLARLHQVHIYDTDQLLEAGSTKEGLSKIHMETGIPQALILQLISYANLMRVQGINHLNAERLYWLGINSVDTLSMCDSASLSKRLKKAFNRFGHDRTPSESIIDRWIRIANSFTLLNILKELYVIQEL
jgi:hypothetical protein